MSTAVSGDVLARRRRLAGAGFVVLLLLSVFWPSPIVSTNRLCCDAALEIDELSFLGREAPSWDVVFWYLVGVFAIILLQSGHYEWRDFGQVRSAMSGRAHHRRWPILLLLIGGGVAVAALWLFADARLIALAEAVQSDAIESAIRLLNRFGGGMNPALVVGFFVIAGVVYQHPLWTRYGVAMAVAGLAAGLTAQILKALIGRTRPELWLGPFHHAWAAASSFPSGHTVGAFALAGVLVVGSRSIVVRVIAFALAAAVGVSRVLAFRHWPSDVAASALLGLMAAGLVWARAARD